MKQNGQGNSSDYSSQLIMKLKLLYLLFYEESLSFMAEFNAAQAGNRFVLRNWIKI